MSGRRALSRRSRAWPWMKALPERSADPRRAEVPTGVQEVEEAEDPLELLPHGGAQAPLDGLLPRLGGGDLAEDLVRAVVAEDLGAEGGLQGARVELDVGMLVADVDERDERPQAQGRVALEEVLREDGGRLRRGDPLEHARDRAPHRAVAPRIGQGLRGGQEGRVARRDEGGRGLLGEWRPAERVEEGARERRRPVPSGGADRRPGHLVVLVLDEPAQRVLERQGQPLRQAGRLEAGPSPGSALLGHHRLEEGLRRLETLLAQAGEHRHHRRAHGEVGEVTEVREPRERVHVGVAREVEERLGPDLEVRIL